MGCLLPIISLFMPRVVMGFIWLLTHWFSLAFKTTIWPLLGFLFMPYTTLAYMGAMLNGGGHITLFWLIVLVIAVMWDLGGQGRSLWRKKR
jgi:hypothetical protein